MSWDLVMWPMMLLKSLEFRIYVLGSPMMMSLWLLFFLFIGTCLLMFDMPLCLGCLSSRLGLWTDMNKIYLTTAIQYQINHYELGSVFLASKRISKNFQNQPTTDTTVLQCLETFFWKHVSVIFCEFQQQQRWFPLPCHCKADGNTSGGSGRYPSGVPLFRFKQSCWLVWAEDSWSSKSPESFIFVRLNNIRSLDPHTSRVSECFKTCFSLVSFLDL